MEKFVEYLPYIIAILVAILAIVTYLLIKNVKNKKTMEVLNEYQLRFNKIKSVPLAFKLSKASSIAKIDGDIVETVDGYKEDFERINTTLNELSTTLENIEDTLALRNVKKAVSLLESMEDTLANSEEEVAKIDEFLDTILEREANQREYANILKDRFMILKDEVLKKAPILGSAYPNIESKISECEDSFSAFEEWMYAQEYLKANEELENAKRIIDEVTERLEKTPALMQVLKGDVAYLRDEVIEKYSLLKQRGVYTQALEIDRKLETVDALTKELINNVQVGELENVAERSAKLVEDLKDISISLNLENEAFSKIKDDLATLTGIIESIKETYDYIVTSYNESPNKYVNEEYSVLAKGRTEYYNGLNAKLADVKRGIGEGLKPNAEMDADIVRLTEELTSKYEVLEQLKNAIDSTKNDEATARNQLLKFQVILVEIKTKLKSHKLPSIDSRYKDDLKQAQSMIEEIKTNLSEVTIDFNKLNKNVKDAMDYIYTLYNNINNIISMASMAENAIVFGNKYRSSFPEVDSELTRAELFYGNGEYTQSLTAAIECIEKLLPKSSASTKELINA